MRRILLIDDNPIVLRVIAAMLERFDYEVIPAIDGEEGLRLFRERGAHVVITNLVMTGCNGIEVVVAVSHGPRSVPVIAMSEGEPDLLDDAKLVGAAAVLQKPFTSDELLTALQSALTQAAEAERTTPDIS